MKASIGKIKTEILSSDIVNVVFVGLTEMQSYCGPEEELTGGGEYVNTNGYGHELFNFKYDDGYCYGYTPHIWEINPE